MRFTRVKGYIRKIRREKTEPSITGIDKNVLLSEFKERHQYYGSVEYPFVTLSLPSIKEKYFETIT